MTQLSTLPCNGGGIIKNLDVDTMQYFPAGVCNSWPQSVGGFSAIIVCEDGALIYKNFTRQHCMGAPAFATSYCPWIQKNHGATSCVSQCGGGGCTYVHRTIYYDATGCNPDGSPSGYTDEEILVTTADRSILNFCWNNSMIISNDTHILELAYTTTDCSGDPVQSEVSDSLGDPVCSDPFGIPYFVNANKYEVVQLSNASEYYIIPTSHPVTPPSNPSNPSSYPATAKPSVSVSETTLQLSPAINVTSDALSVAIAVLAVIICFGLIIFLGVCFTWRRRKEMNSVVSDEAARVPGSPVVRSENAKKQLLRILSDWGLSQYYQMLVEIQGYDRIDDWKDVTLEQLENNMNFKPGHAHRFVRNTEEYFKQQEADDVEVIQKQMTNVSTVEGNGAVTAAFEAHGGREGQHAVVPAKEEDDSIDEELYAPQQQTTDDETTKDQTRDAPQQKPDDEATTKNAVIHVSSVMHGSVIKTQKP